MSDDKKAAADDTPSDDDTLTDDDKPAADDKPATDDKPAADDKPATDDKPAADANAAAQAETASASKPKPSRIGIHKARRWGLIALLLVLLVPALIFGAWAWITLNYSYSKGLRSGYVQKLSRKGWLCKTWEGELAMVNLPGTMPEIFYFSVRDDSIARLVEKNVGKRVSLFYEEHRGVPTSCFAETPYYITNVRPAEQ